MAAFLFIEGDANTKTATSTIFKLFAQDACCKALKVPEADRSRVRFGRLRTNGAAL